MKLKICGMKYNDNISLISKLNPDYMGFIFYNKSKRFFDNEPIPRVNKNIKKVGIFVNPEIEYLNFIIKINKPYFLSGGIGLHNIEELKDFFSSTISKYCFAVDINSHFEIEYAKKDYELIKNFKNEL